MKKSKSEKRKNKKADKAKRKKQLDQTIAWKERQKKPIDSIFEEPNWGY